MIARGYLRDVKAKEVSWLWKPYIAFGKVTLIQGDTRDCGIIVTGRTNPAICICNTQLQMPRWK